MGLIFLRKQGQNRAARIQRQRRRVEAPERRRRRVEDRRTRTWPMQVTFGEEGSWVSMAVAAAFFFLMNIIGLERLPLLLLPTLLLKNLINGGGNFSARPGLEIGFADGFILENPFLLPQSPFEKILLQSFFCSSFCNRRRGDGRFPAEFFTGRVRRFRFAMEIYEFFNYYYFFGNICFVFVWIYLYVWECTDGESTAQIFFYILRLEAFVFMRLFW